jgi:peptide methionine sulfoxide reductase msrA/msrB
MNRVEIISKSTGIHLGHVFEDGPDSSRRFCINASVLDFIADIKL